MLYPLSYERSHCSILHSEPRRCGQDSRAQGHSIHGTSNQRASRPSWYSGGLAQLTGDEPEPRTARWADAEMVTTVYSKSDETRFASLAASGQLIFHR
jgi:hypothetical protein